MIHALELISSAIGMELATDPSKAWEISGFLGRCLKSVWEVSECCLGGVWEVSEECLGSV